MYPFKKLFGSFVLAATVFSGSIVSAQSALYLKPSIGVGASTSEFHHKADRALSYHITAGIGYRIKNIRLESGLGLLKLGTKETYFGGCFSPPYTQTTKTNYYDLIMPVRLTYELPVSRRISVQPSVGAILSYSLHHSWRSVYDPSWEYLAALYLAVLYLVQGLSEFLASFSLMLPTRLASLWNYLPGLHFNTCRSTDRNLAGVSEAEGLTTQCLMQVSTFTFRNECLRILPKLIRHKPYLCSPEINSSNERGKITELLRRNNRKGYSRRQEWWPYTHAFPTGA